MTRYQRIARIGESSEFELWEAADYLNGDMGDYYIMWQNPPDEYFLVQEIQNSDGGDVFVGGDLEEVGGDIFTATDEVAEHLEGETYHIVEFPQGNRKFAWIDDE